ncbi:Hypothetical predicted protein [Cloeon dipterum]|uniref:Erythroid differentiation-related factor 1 n=1 Tax=Cloeon dipterum TaxID=197152 RepID=A0A8S1BV41_9INSE|nr:Hypothetical predicted protein [Cloeon dipterum]
MSAGRSAKVPFEMSADLMSPTNESSDTPRKPIKSTAVVKLSTSEIPNNFEVLQLNTDLNEPPSNWLSTKATNGSSFGFTNASGFNSFRIANMFPDCVGEVDVVSDSENIKKLLKIPYSKGAVSMIVHRVENTLLIDEFDIHKHLMRTAESEWSWLRKFFVEHVMNNLSSKGFHQKDFSIGFSRDALQERKLVSKFLYHSLSETNSPSNAEGCKATKENVEQDAASMYWSSLPEPQLELPDNSVGHEFARNVVWTFEDIQMLLGTDMPIFGGDTHPCISLRLRDMKKPINVLTGIDYWLDNLMCNVPEVVMCCHLDGLVQKYELIKTEDLPHLSGSKFSPKLIHDVAQNILSFLKSNATKAGHTYWLFKGKNEDVVKLYDLSSLCESDTESGDGNPFTVPVAMLLYNVARKMKKQNSKQHGGIRVLLEHCISLLDREKYPKIVTSAHYMLSDLYVPAETNPSDPAFPEEEPEDPETLDGRDENPEQGQEVEEDTNGNVEVGSLCWSNSCTKVQKKTQPPPLSGSISERCQNSLKHIAEGLYCLRQLDTRQIQKEEEEPRMAHPFTAIPMPFASLTSMAVSPTKTEEPKIDSANHWKAQLLTLLYEKALLVAAVLTQHSLATEQYGTALRQVQVLLTLNLGLQKLSKLLGVKHGKEEDKEATKSFLLGQAGDACCMIVQNWSKIDQFKADIATKDDFIEPILKQLQLDVGPYDDDTVPVDLDLPNVKDVLKSSIECYKQALNSKPAPDQFSSLCRRLGNAYNELGVVYMTQANTLVTGAGEKDRNEFNALVKKSLRELELGIAAFEKGGDRNNLALLLLNAGRLMRLCSFVMSPVCRTPMQGQERNYYLKALNYYQKASCVLEKRCEENEQIWDSVNWQLSTTLYNMAVILQDYPDGNKNQQEVEKEVVEHLHKALASCDLSTPGRQLPMYQIRAASLHHKLASLYHKSLRNFVGDDQKRKWQHQLCRNHYEKAADMYKSLEGISEFLRVQLERVAFAEFSAESSNSSGSKRAMWLSAIDLMLGCADLIKVIVKQKEAQDDEEEQLKLLVILEQTMQSILLSLAKLSAKDKANGAKEFKAMYAATLHQVSKEKEDLRTVATRLSTSLKKVNELRKNIM